MTSDGGLLLDGGTPDGATVTIGKPLETYVYIGGYGNAYPHRTYLLDRTTGALTAQGPTVALGDSPSFATASADGKFVYLANESSANAGVTVASVNPTTGQLTSLEREPYGKNGLVFTSLSPDGKFLLATSYNSGELVVYPVGSDGTLSSAIDTESFGSGAETHSVRVHPNGRFAYVPNKGRGSVAQFARNPADGKLTPLSPSTVDGHDGPRHIALNKAGTFAFLMNENDSHLTSYRIGDDGKLTEVDDKPGTPTSYTGRLWGAHVLVHPSDKFVYISNRGHDSIGVFAVDAAGKLTLVEHVGSQGATPRNFDIEATGKFLIVANQGTNDNANDGTVAVFEIGSDGKLTLKGTPLKNQKAPTGITTITREKPL